MENKLMSVGPEHYNFCTYFDKNYFFKGLTLYRSLLNTCVDFRLWVLCLDDETFSLLSEMGFDKLNLIRLSELEDYDHELLQVKNTRSIVEYYWTCTPILLRFIFARERELEIITYIDADLFFFSDPSPIFSEFYGHSIMIVPHRYSSEHANKEARAGIYNVSLLIFKRNENSYECLKWWGEKCLNNCSLDSPDGTCGDQKYLDDWPVRFKEVVVLLNKGAGLAPWNVSQYFLHKKEGSVFVDADGLVFYHFHSFRIISKNLYEICYGYTFSLKAKLYIYLPYILDVKKSMLMVQIKYPDFNSGLVSPSRGTFIGFLALFLRLRIIPSA